MILLRPLKDTGHQPFLVGLQEVVTVNYVPDLRHQQKPRLKRGFFVVHNGEGKYNDFVIGNQLKIGSRWIGGESFYDQSVQ
jgi:hypothetical protein